MDVGQKRPLDSSKSLAGPSQAKRMTIRVRDNLTDKMPIPSTNSLETEIKILKEEVRALTWLARKKEQEWDAIIRLLKLKEERLLRSERHHSLEKSTQNDFLVRSGSNDVDMTVKPDIGPIPDINRHKFQSTDQLSSYFNLSKSFTVLKDTSGLPIVIKVIPEKVATALPPNVQLPNTPLPSSSLMPMNGPGLSPTIVSTRSLAGLTSDNDDIEIIETSTGAATNKMPNAIFKILPRNSQAQNARPTVSFTLPKTRVITTTTTTIQTSKPISSSTLGPSNTSPISNTVVESKSPSLIITKKSSAIGTSPSTSLKAGSSNLQLNPSSVKSTMASTGSSDVQRTSSASTSISSLTATNVSTTVNSGTSTVKLNCECCKIKPAQFLCAGCSKRSYCSRDCQEKDWDSHCDDCA